MQMQRFVHMPDVFVSLQTFFQIPWGCFRLKPLLPIDFESAWLFNVAAQRKFYR